MGNEKDGKTTTSVGSSSPLPPIPILHLAIKTQGLAKDEGMTMMCNDPLSADSHSVILALPSVVIRVIQGHVEIGVFGYAALRPSHQVSAVQGRRNIQGLTLSARSFLSFLKPALVLPRSAICPSLKSKIIPPEEWEIFGLRKQRDRYHSFFWGFSLSSRAM